MLVTGEGWQGPKAVVYGACRPVVGVAVELADAGVKVSASTWEWSLPPNVERGRNYADMAAARSLLSWPNELLGVNWMGDLEHDPPASFVAGRVERELGSWTLVLTLSPTT